MKASLFDTYRLMVKAKAKGKPECDMPRLSQEELSQIGSLLKDELVKAQAEENSRKLRLVSSNPDKEVPTNPVNPIPEREGEKEPEADPDTVDEGEEDLEGEEDHDDNDNPEGGN